MAIHKEYLEKDLSALDVPEFHVVGVQQAVTNQWHRTICSHLCPGRLPTVSKQQILKIC